MVGAIAILPHDLPALSVERHLHRRVAASRCCLLTFQCHSPQIPGPLNPSEPWEVTAWAEVASPPSVRWPRTAEGQVSTLLSLAGRAHLYPARMFMSVDFPAPEGPMMATSSPLLNFPEIPFRRVLYPARNRSHSPSSKRRTHWLYPRGCWYISPRNPGPRQEVSHHSTKCRFLGKKMDLMSFLHLCVLL